MTPKSSTTSSSIDWVKDGLKDKADQQWVEAKVENLQYRIKNLERRNEETKEISLKASDQAMTPHRCTQQMVFESLDGRVASWTKWWKRIVIIVIAAVVTSAGAITGWMYSHKVLKDDVKALQGNMTNIEGSVSKIGKSQEELKDAFMRSEKDVKAQNVRQLEGVKGAFRDVLKELKFDEKSKGKRGRRKL